MPLAHTWAPTCSARHNLAKHEKGCLFYNFTVICMPLCPLPWLTAGTELKFICCGWFMGEAARAPIGAWDIWAVGRAIWLNWFIPGQKSGPQCSAMYTYIFSDTFSALLWAVSCFESCPPVGLRARSDRACFAGYKTRDAPHCLFSGHKKEQSFIVARQQ